VDLEETLEEDGVAFEGVEDAGAEARRAIHLQQAAGHEPGSELDAGVGVLVGGEVVGVEGAGERIGLTEAEGETIAGDGIDGA